MTFKILVFLLNVVLPLIAGFALQRITRIPREKFNIMIKINLALFLPMATMLSFWNMNFTRDALFLPLIGFIIPLVGLFLGIIIGKMRYDSSRKKGSFVACAMLSNRKTIGGLTAYIIFGEIAYLYMNLILLFNDITSYFIAHPIGHYYGHSDKGKYRVTLKSLVLRITNIGIVGILLGVTLNLSGISRPAAFAQVLDKLIKICGWIALMPIGASIDFSRVKDYFKDIPSLFLIKFIIMPVLTMLMAYPVIKDPIALATVFIIAIAPVAINAVVVAKLNNLDEDLAISAFLTSTLVFIVIIFPLLLIAGQWITTL
jgi:predicted permease